MKSFIYIIILISIIFQKAYAQNDAIIISNIDKQLKENRLSISDVLSNDSLMYLHAQTAFRDMIKANAKPGYLSIITSHEAGTQITIKGSVTDEKGNTIKNALVYVYQTSDKGWYSDTGAHILIYEGDIRHARIFGYFKTDDKGAFSFETIKPKGYPKSDLAAHIHIQFWDKNNEPLFGPGELQFEDDPRMTPARKAKSLQEGFLISKNSGNEQKPVYEFKIVLHE